MSINFTMRVQVVSTYLDIDTKEVLHRSSVLDSTLDLGSYRALRKIIPIGDNGDMEDCGRVHLDVYEAIQWLSTTRATNSTGFQVKAALHYLMALDDMPSDGETELVAVECQVTWA